MLVTEHVGYSSVYVSHHWDGNFFHLVEALQHDFDTKWHAYHAFVTAKGNGISQVIYMALACVFGE